jgi:hypothetical protein
VHAAGIDALLLGLHRQLNEWLALLSPKTFGFGVLDADRERALVSTAKRLVHIHT